jgi:hypothetical protein
MPASLRGLLRFASQLVGLAALVVGQRQCGFLRIVSDGSPQDHTGILGAKDQPESEQ